MNGLRFRVALVGAKRDADMAEITDAIFRELADWECERFVTLREFLSCEFSADLAVVCQTWRDEHSAEEVRKALATFPVARWMCITGAWCESEGRHGSHWPMAVRVPAWAAVARLQLEAEVVRGNIPALALTASREEVFEHQSRPLPVRPHFNPSITVKVVSPDRGYRLWLEELCQHAGLSVIERQDKSPPKLLLVDLDPFDDKQAARLGEFRAANPHSIVFGFVGLVTQESTELGKSVGLERVLSKLTPGSLFVEMLQETVTGMDKATKRC